MDLLDSLQFWFNSLSVPTAQYLRMVFAEWMSVKLPSLSLSQIDKIQEFPKISMKSLFYRPLLVDLRKTTLDISAYYK